MLSEEVDKAIQEIVRNPFNYSEANDASRTISLGDLVDRLAICNLKLFKVKDLQAISTGDDALPLIKQDIALCKERSQLKRGIDYKVAEMVKDEITGNLEITTEEKNYG